MATGHNVEFTRGIYTAAHRSCALYGWL